jgi:hypothetical protein
VAQSTEHHPNAPRTEGREDALVRASCWRKARILECALVAALLVARLAFGSVVPRWADWVVIVAMWWLFSAWAARSRAWPMATVGVMAYLLGIYLFRHLPGVLGWWEHQH